MRYVHIQSILPQEDVIALKIKTGESSVKEAVSKAIYHYLKCGEKKKKKRKKKKLKLKRRINRKIDN